MLFRSPDCKELGLWFFNGFINKQPMEEVVERSRTGARRIGFVALSFAIGIHTVTVLIFATQNTHEWWHTAVLPPDFIAMVVASGGSLVLVLAIALAGKDSFEENLESYLIICKIVATALAVHFFLRTDTRSVCRRGTLPEGLFTVKTPMKPQQMPADSIIR